VAKKCSEIALKFSNKSVLKFYFVLLGPRKFILWLFVLVVMHCRMCFFSFKNLLAGLFSPYKLCPCPSLHPRLQVLSCAIHGTDFAVVCVSFVMCFGNVCFISCFGMLELLRNCYIDVL